MGLIWLRPFQIYLGRHHCLVFTLVAILVSTMFFKMGSEEHTSHFQSIGSETYSYDFPLFSNNSGCPMLHSFHLSKAIMSDSILQHRNLKKISEFYSTAESIMDVARNISKVFGVDALPPTKPSQTCVIVSSGGILLQYPNLGELIDSYDYVIRMNMAPTKNYEKYVGTKTSLDFAYWRSLKLALATGRGKNNTHFVYGGMNKSDFANLLSLLRSNKTSELAMMYRSSNLTLFSHYTMDWITKTFWVGRKKRKGVRPTTGLQALLIAAHWCPTPLDFAGFGFVFNKTVPYHYFDESYMHTGWHNTTNELDVIRKLQTCQLIGKDLTHSLG